MLHLCRRIKKKKSSYVYILVSDDRCLKNSHAFDSTVWDTAEFIHWFYNGLRSYPVTRPSAQQNALPAELLWHGVDYQMDKLSVSHHPVRVPLNLHMQSVCVVSFHICYQLPVT